MTKRFLSARESIKKYEIILLKQLLVDNAPSALVELEKLPPEIIADVLAASQILAQIRPTMWSSSAPPVMVERRVELGLGLDSAVRRLWDNGISDTFRISTLAELERSQSARDGAPKSVTDALAKLYGLSWKDLRRPCSDAPVKLTKPE